MTFDQQPSRYDPNAFPASLRAVSFVLSIAVVGIIVFGAATTAAIALA